MICACCFLKKEYYWIFKFGRRKRTTSFEKPYVSIFVYVMPNDVLKPSMFIKLDKGPTMMVKALQMHFALEYKMFETPADIVESAIFEMYTRMIVCEVRDDNRVL